MFKVGDEVIVTNINSKDKADSIGGIYTIQEKKDGKYRLWNYWFNTTDVPLFSEDEIRLVTSEDKVKKLEKAHAELRNRIDNLEMRMKNNLESQSRVDGESISRGIWLEGSKMKRSILDTIKDNKLLVFAWFLVMVLFISAFIAIAWAS